MAIWKRYNGKETVRWGERVVKAVVEGGMGEEEMRRRGLLRKLRKLEEVAVG